MPIKQRIGPILVWASVLIPLVFWLFTETASGRRFRGASVLVDLGQIAGLVGMAMLSVAFVLSSRARFLEDYFGGLDKMYQLHHRLGLTAFVLLLIHPIAHALRFVPAQIDKALLFLLPTHEHLAINLGVYAFWALVLLMGPTQFIKVPYDKWKLSHKFMGAVLILGTVHMLTVPTSRGRPVALQANEFLWYYLLFLAVLGSLCFLHKMLIPPLLAKRQRYAVSTVNRLNDDVLEIALAPRGRPVEFVPGQFVFVTFYEDGLPVESHPFTIATPPDQGEITLTVKALGDFTGALYQKLQRGTVAKVEGPYGRFDYRAGARQQIWLAAGVGVVPFLSWARDLARRPGEPIRARFYYCVHSRADAVHFREFERLAGLRPGLQVALVCSEEQGHLRAADIGDLNNKDIFMCGPKRFTGDLRHQLQQLGVPGSRIHFEDFEFR
jgi:predicted ferric reductase